MPSLNELNFSGNTMLIRTNFSDDFIECLQKARLPTNPFDLVGAKIVFETQSSKGETYFGTVAGLSVKSECIDLFITVPSWEGEPINNLRLTIETGHWA
ncbi:MAG: hypothetical protein ABIP54_00815, partial [Candidatus Andersenbacteria bacterium]